MTDLVERLRSMAGWLAAPAGGGFDARSVTEAADEIERLRAENQRLTDENARAWNACNEECERKEQLQAKIDAYAAGRRDLGVPFDVFMAAHDALLAAATPKEDDRG